MRACALPMLKLPSRAASRAAERTKGCEEVAVADAGSVAETEARTEVVAAPVGLVESLGAATGVVLETEGVAGKPAVGGAGEAASACEVTAKGEKVVSATHKENWAFIAKELTMRLGGRAETAALSSGANKRSF